MRRDPSVRSGAERIQRLTFRQSIRGAVAPRHWHRATFTNAMSHIAIQEHLNGKVVAWLEKVSDEQYRR